MSKTKTHHLTEAERLEFALWQLSKGNPEPARRNLERHWNMDPGQRMTTLIEALRAYDQRQVQSFVTTSNSSNGVAMIPTADGGWRDVNTTSGTPRTTFQGRAVRIVTDEPGIHFKELITAVLDSGDQNPDDQELRKAVARALHRFAKHGILVRDLDYDTWTMP